VRKLADALRREARTDAIRGARGVDGVRGGNRVQPATKEEAVVKTHGAHGAARVLAVEKVFALSGRADGGPRSITGGGETVRREASKLPGRR